MRAVLVALPSRRLVALNRVLGRGQALTVACHRGYHEVSYQEAGNPGQVLSYQVDAGNKEKDHIGNLGDDAIQVEIHHAPWNPADVNLVQGKYPSPHPPGEEPVYKLNQSRFFPGRTVAGTEGYGRIIQTSPKHDNAFLAVGDWVAFAASGLGTLRSSIWLPREAVVLPIQRREVFEGKDVDGNKAAGVATLFQLGGTALGMLRSFTSLHPGDVVLQNAGNSAVGFVASQLAKSMNLNMVSMVRRGNKTPDQFDAMVHHLKAFGKADIVVAQEDLVDDRAAVNALKAEIKKLSPRPPMLAFNAVGGAPSSVLMQLLGQGGIHVTYGGMSMRPVSVATTHLIFKDIQVRGYWHSRWMIQQNYATKIAMVNELVDAYLDGTLQPPPVQVFPLSQISEALQFGDKQSEETIRSKVVFDCREI